MIVIDPINQNYALDIKVKDKTVRLVFKQLNYRTKALISSLTTELKGGQVLIDSVMNSFYIVKYSLKDIIGAKLKDGSDFKLDFENDCLTDDCTEKILAAKFANSLIIAANSMLESIPDEIINPFTNKKLEDVELISPDELLIVKK